VELVGSGPPHERRPRGRKIWSPSHHGPRTEPVPGRIEVRSGSGKSSPSRLEFVPEVPPAASVALVVVLVAVHPWEHRSVHPGLVQPIVGMLHHGRVVVHQRGAVHVVVVRWPPHRVQVLDIGVHRGSLVRRVHPSLEQLSVHHDLRIAHLQVPGRSVVVRVGDVVRHRHLLESVVEGFLAFATLDWVEVTLAPTVGAFPAIVFAVPSSAVVTIGVRSLSGHASAPVSVPATKHVVSDFFHRQ
jgi:hypothetical protein